MAAHVDLARDVDNTPLAEGELAPGVGCLAVHQLGVWVDGSPCAGGSVGERDPGGLVGSQGGGDGGLHRVDPRAQDAPDDEDQVFTGIVDELVLVGTVRTQPSLSVVGVRVQADGFQTQGGEFGGIDIGEGCITFPVW